MKNISKYKVEKGIYIPIILFFLISIVTIYCTKSLLPSEYSLLWIKQIAWYTIGITIAFIMMKLGNKFLYNNAWLFYFIGVLLLLLVLFFGTDINNARCWFKIPYLGTFQPSEFMKVFLIIILSKQITDFNERYDNPEVVDEFKFIIKILILVLIPSILTFIEPDTGAVIMYIIITFVMLFIGGFRKRWFILTLLALVVMLGGIITLYKLNGDLFIKIFGTSLFYRMDRIFNWTSSSGLQLRNSLIAIGSAGAFGHGFNHTPIYFPEMQTDFIFGVFASNFGLFGSLLLITLIVTFDINLISTVNKTNSMYDKYAIGGIIGVLLLQQIYNISMTVGLLPIMGITLPFLSYGGSSLLSYMLLLGIIFNVSNGSLRYTN